jgi:L-ascorbate metabolism protein UlaG (beta-lactamase superfamily)
MAVRKKIEMLLDYSTIKFHGVAAYELISRDGRRILMDPFIDENPGATVSSDSFDRVDLVIVSHAAFDHLGDTAKIARKYGCPVICGGEVRAWLVSQGVDVEQIQATTWGIRVEVAGFEVQPVQCQHWSQIKMPDGNLISGVPMAFVVYLDEGVRFYHYGDTAVFSDMKLQAELYQPTVGCIGIANPHEIMHRLDMPGKLLTAEMSPREGAMAATWLGLETVLPCHYINPDDADVRDFLIHLDSIGGPDGPSPHVLSPGQAITFPESGEAPSIVDEDGLAKVEETA